jgi:hypothetical protein
MFPGRMNKQGDQAIQFSGTPESYDEISLWFGPSFDLKLEFAFDPHDVAADIQPVILVSEDWYARKGDWIILRKETEVLVIERRFEV